MANDLTGDFDVVAEFSVPAANRVLAAMHRGQRFPHSLSMRVDDSHRIHGSVLERMVALSIVDPVGNAVVNPVLLALPRSSLRFIRPSDAVFSALDSVANDPEVHSGPGLGDYTGLQGVAQLQLSTPTMTIPDESGTRMTVHMQLRARWFPDPDTPPMPEFLRGEIQITVGVDRVASQVGNVVDIDLKPQNVEVTFIRVWNSSRVSLGVGGHALDALGVGGQALNAGEINKIKQVIRNSILTSFQPFNAVLPSSVQYMQFKGLAGDSPAIGMLLNMGDAAGDRGSVNDVFLGDEDDFAFAAGRDFILGTFNSVLNQVFQVRQFTITRTVRTYFLGVKTSQFNITYTVYLDRLTVDLQDGQILLTIEGHAHTGSFLPDFNFWAKQAFTLNLVATTAGGPLNTAELAFLGDVVADAHATGGGVASWLLGLFVNIQNEVKTSMLSEMRQKRDQFLTQVQAQGTVRDMLNADRNLGGFLKSLMNPAPKPGGAPQEELSPQLAYTSFEIKPAGLILHGSLAVPEWPAVHAEFEITPNDYNALNSWIPGGTIQQYTWVPPGKPSLRIEPNTFVFVEPGTPTLRGMNICVIVEGSRVSASGPVVQQHVSARTCRWISFPLTITGERLSARQALPDVALTRITDSGALEVAGHTSPWTAAGAPAAGSANLIVHFPEEKALANLDFLTQALRQSERSDTATAILAVVLPDQLAKVKPAEGLIFADDGAWEHLLEVKRRPATFVIGTSGEVVWRHEGELTGADLAAALRTHLVAGGVFRSRLLQLSVRIGQPPPNFIFEYAPGRELTLRKLGGRPVVLVFWKSSSKPSLETLRQLEKTMGEAGGRGPVVLAINDGEAPELAKKVAAQHGLSALVVTDPQRQISLAYGVNLWPTTVFVDSLGVVRDIRYGLFPVEQVKHASQEKTAAAQ